MVIALQIVFLLYTSLLSILTLWVPMTSHMQTMPVMLFLHANMLIVILITALAVLAWRKRLNKPLSFIYMIFLASTFAPNFYYTFISHVDSHMGSFSMFSLMPISSIFFFIAAPESSGERMANHSSELDSTNNFTSPYKASSESIERHHYTRDWTLCEIRMSTRTISRSSLIQRAWTTSNEQPLLYP